MKKQIQGRCHITMRIIDMKTGERRELTQMEIAERLQKILSIPPDQRIRKNFPHQEQKAPQ